MLKSLSDLGMGNRDTLEDIIEQEASQFASLAKKKQGQQLTSRVKSIKFKYAKKKLLFNWYSSCTGTFHALYQQCHLETCHRKEDSAG